MMRYRRVRDSKRLAFAALLAAAYVVLETYRLDLAISNRVYGIGGVLLGLFICSFPAANFLDLILFERLAALPPVPRGAQAWWIGQNFGVMLAGWLVVVVGTLHVVARLP